MTYTWSDSAVRTAVGAILDGVRRHLAERGGDGRKQSRDQLATLVASHVRHLRTEDDLLLPAGLTSSERQEVWATAMRAALAELAGLGRLEPLLADDDIVDIEINRHDQVWITPKNGVRYRGEPVADSKDELLDLGRRIARNVGGIEGEREWSTTSPEADVVLRSGHRVHLVRDVTIDPSITIRQPDLTIRRVSQLTELGSMHPRVAEFLSAAMRFGAHILVVGGTGSGKTTTSRCLLNELAPALRIITIEDARELCLTHPEMLDEHGQPLHDNAVEIVTKKGNAEGAGRFTLADALISTKRMNPDRVIVGEVRGDEAFWMLDAMKGEAGGSLCTIHADTCRDGLERLATMAARHSDMSEAGGLQGVASAIDIVICQRKSVTHGRRYITEVVEVEGLEDQGGGRGILSLNELFRVTVDGQLVESGNPTTRLADKMRDNGWGGSLRAVHQ